MKKILIVFMLTLSYALSAEIGVDQSIQLNFPREEALKRSLEICKEKEFSHFLITKISYKDNQGQHLLFTGVPQDRSGVLLSETVTQEFGFPLGTIEVQFESIFYKEAPNDPLAIEGRTYECDLKNAFQSQQTIGYEVLNQTTQLIFSITSTVERAAMICQEKNFSHFLVRRITYKDERGQSLAFIGIPEAEDGILISERIVEEYESPVGPLTAEFEAFFFKEAPRDPLAITVGRLVGFLD